VGLLDRILGRRAGGGSPAGDEALPFPALSPQEAARECAAGSLRVLDVRFDGEFASRRLPRSLLVPLPEIRDRIGEIDPDADWLVVCGGGARSLAACRFLHERGRRVRWLRGGLTAYPGPFEES
jgi:rhodanese-related sulfurtransferase